MHQGLLHLHNLLRWAVLLFGVLSLISGLRGFNSRAEFGKGDKRNSLLFLVFCDIQLLLGLFLYFTGDAGFNMLKAGVMKDPVGRFWAVEHQAGMLLAIILVHVGYAGTKGSRPGPAKLKKLFWCSLVALLLMVASIPWPGRGAGIARPLVPGMAATE